jgi:hypothetical protein
MGGYALDLFSGTGSVGKVLSQMGFTVIYLDKNVNRKADLPVDIFDWDYKKLGVGYFDVIAASPPCEEYSAAKIVSDRNFELADNIVEKTLEIIHFFQPAVWWIENPRLVMLKTREVVKGLDFVDLDYCQFSNWGYRKETRFWCCPELAILKPKTCNRKPCSNCIPGPNTVKGWWTESQIFNQPKGTDTRRCSDLPHVRSTKISIQ